jgi:heme-degrading monooxygenase HmoA
MYAVIFRAEIAELDAEYLAMAERMRNLAIDQYGCKEFIANTEGNTEIAISYWENESQIKEWKNNSEHLSAQSKGRSKWYKSYTVQFVEVIREYSSNT